jgi:superfamily II DNA helicase RecQ
LLSRRFIDIVLRDKTFTSRVLSVVVDEAHVVSHWGAGFRKKYGELGMLRAFLPRGTSMVAMSATLSPGVQSDVLRKLEFDEANYEACDAGNDRPNVSLVVRAIEHTQESLADLNFVIPKDVKKVEDIPLTMIYADSVPLGPDIVQHLDRLLPAHLQGLGVVRPFSAAGTQEYRTDAMTEFKSGTSVRVLVCTDAAGMVCHPILLVSQCSLPSVGM